MINSGRAIAMGIVGGTQNTEIASLKAHNHKVWPVHFLSFARLFSLDPSKAVWTVPVTWNLDEGPAVVNALIVWM